MNHSRKLYFGLTSFICLESSSREGGCAAIFDVLLLDIGLPGMNGFDLLKKLHISHPDLPILMLSMYPEETYESRALKFGASGYLSKNSPIETLTSAIRTVSGGGKHFSRNIAEKQASYISLILG